MIHNPSFSYSTIPPARGTLRRCFLRGGRGGIFGRLLLGAVAGSAVGAFGAVGAPASGFRSAELRPMNGPASMDADPESLRNEGGALARAGRIEEAVRYFQKAAERSPDDAGAWNDLGYTYLRLSAYPRARAAFEAALELDPENGLAHYNKALLHYELREYDSAIFHRDRAEACGYVGAPVFRRRLDLHRRARLR